MIRSADYSLCRAQQKSRHALHRVHKFDQVFRVEEGTGEAVLDGVATAISAGFAALVPAGTNHNIVNTGNVPLKLYTLDAPPHQRARRRPPYLR